MSCRPASARSIEDFTALHEGLPPQQSACSSYGSPVKPVHKLGHITEIQYRKRIPGKVQPYWHPFAVHARPTLGKDARGNLVIYAGRYRVLTTGITDRKPSEVRTESIPPTPKTLSDLGTLEWIRYDSGKGTKTYRPSARSMLVHDEHGNLHIVRTTHAEEDMAHRKGKHNPIQIHGKGGANQAKDIVMASAFVGVTVAVYHELISRMLPLSLMGYQRAAAQAGIGLGLAVLGAKIHEIPPEVLLGVGTGGVVTGGVAAMNEWRARKALNPSGAAQLGPGGIPVGYNRIDRAACAVR